jgi:regulatory protein
MGFRRTQKSIGPERSADLKGVRSAAIALLARRDFASGELAQRLVERGWDATATATVITELIEERALDDARFAENYVAYHANRGQGPMRISMDLRALGLPVELIDGAVAGGSDWRARARAARVRRFGPDAPEAWPEKSRQARFLQYRGFSSDHIRAALGTDFNLDDDT